MAENSNLNETLSPQIFHGWTAPTTVGAATTIQQVHTVSNHHGNVILAGRDVILQNQDQGLLNGSVLNILNVLCGVPNLRNTHLDILSKATHGTGLWFLRTKNYLFWVDLNGTLKILWGTGIPGAGKTVLASIVIDDLEARVSEAGGSICVGYIYFRYSDVAGLTVRDILEILVKQAVERHNDCARLAQQVYARHNRERTQPSETELLSLLGQFTAAKRITFYVLDALDEAPQRLQVALVQRLSTLNARLFITSRPLRDVEEKLAGVSSFTIIAQESDLDLHIKKEIAHSRSLQHLLDDAEPSFRKNLISSVKQSCGGMFLHASLQLDVISRCSSLQDVADALQDFPSDIDAVYRQAWQRICQNTPKNALLVKAVLMWVLTATRPMTIEELRCAVATSPDTYMFELKRLVPVATLLTLCCGLVTVEEETKLARLVHYTARGTLEELLHEHFSHPHALPAMVCMTHLIGCGVQEAPISSEDEYKVALHVDPLLTYASQSWAMHARESLDVSAVCSLIAEFVSRCKAFPSFTHPTESHDFDILSPLHLLALHHLPLKLLRQEAVADPNVPTKIVGDSPIKLAAGFGNEAMVQELLLLPDIQVNQVNRDGTTALMVAAEEGYESIVRILLLRPEISVNMSDCFKRAALVSSAQRGHEPIVSALLSHRDTNVNLVSSAGWSALHRASINDHHAIVKLLLAHHGIDVNLANRFRSASTPLMEAASRGYEGTMKLLLAHPNIDINRTDGKGASALVVAIANGHEGAVLLLLSHPNINVNLLNIASSSGRTALTEASARGYVRLVKVLLWHPEIKVNLVDSTGSTALLWAIAQGNENTVQLLLQHPDIDVNLGNNVGRSGWTALMEAIDRGHTGIVQILLSHPDIELNLTDSEGWSALLCAVSRRNVAIVGLLLAQHDIRLNVINNNGWSPLLWAAARGYERIVQLLLAHPNINVNLTNAGDRSGPTALIEAVNRGHDSIVKLLLERYDIEVNLLDSQGRSALLRAAALGYTSIVELLLAHPGVQVGVADNGGRSALMFAAKKGYDDIVKLLLIHQANLVHLVDQGGQSALQLAREADHAECAWLLTSALTMSQSHQSPVTSNSLQVIEQLGNWG